MSATYYPVFYWDAHERRFHMGWRPSGNFFPNLSDRHFTVQTFQTYEGLENFILKRVKTHPRQYYLPIESLLALEKLREEVKCQLKN